MKSLTLNERNNIEDFEQQNASTRSIFSKNTTLEKTNDRNSRSCCFCYIDDIHKITPKTDMLDQIVKTISTETIIPDHNPTKLTTLLKAETFHTQTPRNRNYSNDRSRKFSSNRY